MPAVSILEVWCSCGKGLCGQCEDTSGGVIIEPCGQCLNEARDEGYEEGNQEAKRDIIDKITNDISDICLQLDCELRYGTGEACCIKDCAVDKMRGRLWKD